MFWAIIIKILAVLFGTGLAGGVISINREYRKKVREFQKENSEAIDKLSVKRHMFITTLLTPLASLCAIIATGVFIYYFPNDLENLDDNDGFGFFIIIPVAAVLSAAIGLGDKMNDKIRQLERYHSFKAHISEKQEKLFSYAKDVFGIESELLTPYQLHEKIEFRYRHLLAMAKIGVFQNFRDLYHLEQSYEYASQQYEELINRQSAFQNEFGLFVFNPVPSRFFS